MQANLEKARVLESDPHALDHDAMHISFRFTSFNDSAWRSARDTGALTYMPTVEVQKYADVYNEQEIVTQQAIAISTHLSDLAAPLYMEKAISDLPPADVHELLRACSATELHLDTLKQLVERLEQDYANTLAK